MWGLFEYAMATGNAAARRSPADGATELFLSHRIFRRGGSGPPVKGSWTALHYPPYWHYDVLQALHLLARMGHARDERTGDALDLLEQRRLPDGRWQAGSYWWQPAQSPRAPEVVDWGRGEPNEMITLNALRVLQGAPAAPDRPLAHRVPRTGSRIYSIPMLKFLSRLTDSNDREVRRFEPTVARINELEPEYAALTDADLRGKTEQFRARLRDSLGDLLIPIEQRALTPEEAAESELVVADPTRLSEERKEQHKRERAADRRGARRDPARGLRRRPRGDAASPRPSATTTSS